MLYEKLSDKTIDEIDLALRDSAGRHQFGVLHVHDLRQAMKNKGVEYHRQCSVFELCNPRHAKRVLEADPAVSSMLPCRISVYETSDGLMLSAILPSAMMSMFSDPNIKEVAEEVEVVLKAMIDESA
ncbi:DUF302 domain-containing protein [Paludibaculum fermentans]|uniref:DUF302 domain-containing protein n=1 Tax=Paludibaculum fermentans TaxID=1473598 RepID=A0A7S7NQI0_PALFE|nr:DUF302 domain-containing protein [Paludibaculum fermentans]QOY87859.1 DUF302 domain-containing protein [Paludibaculum fermentans]